MAKTATHRPVEALTADETSFLRRAEERFKQNMNWLEFEELAFGMRSPLFARKRSHQNVVEHPLYVALRDMWLELGVRQGYIANPTNEDATDAARRETAGRG